MTASGVPNREMANSDLRVLVALSAIAFSAEPGEDWSWCYLDEVAFAVRPQ
jgi:hypothetical protein